jgi:outer membrane protein assembly factor BamB
MPVISLSKPFSVLALLALLSSAQVPAEPATAPLFWPDKNGPARDSKVPEADAAKLPAKWDGASGRGIVWRLALENEGHSTPVIGGDLIWFTSATTHGTRQWLHAVNRHTGEVAHEILLFENADPEPLGNPLNNYASPSCVLEENAVYAHFGTYGTACVAPATGEVVWQRRDINVNHYRGPGSSPLLHENLLILTFDGIDKQFVTALDKTTGSTVWITPRTTDYGDLDAEGRPTRGGDMRKAYHTPLVLDLAGEKHLVSVGSRAAFGYEPATGKELWTLPHGGFNAAVRPLLHDGVLVINTGAERAELIGVRVDNAMRGDISATHQIWKHDKRNSSESQSLLHEGRIFQITRGGILTCVDAATGEEVSESRLAGQHLPSPILAGDRLYFSNDRGATFIVRADPSLAVLAENELGEAMTASPAVAEGDLYIRTKAALYRITAAR